MPLRNKARTPEPSVHGGHQPAFGAAHGSAAKTVKGLSRRQRATEVNKLTMRMLLSSKGSSGPKRMRISGATSAWDGREASMIAYLEELVSSGAKHIDLSGVGLCETDFVQLRYILADYPAESLNFKGNSIDEVGGRIIQKILEENKNITHVEVDRPDEHSEMSSELYEVLMETAAQNKAREEKRKARKDKESQLRVHREIEAVFLALAVQIQLQEGTARHEVTVEEEHAWQSYLLFFRRRSKELAAEERRLVQLAVRSEMVAVLKNDETYWRAYMEEMETKEMMALCEIEAMIAEGFITNEQNSEREGHKRAERQSWVLARRAEKARWAREKNDRETTELEESDARKVIEKSQGGFWPEFYYDEENERVEAKDREIERIDRTRREEAAKKRAEEAAKERAEKEERERQKAHRDFLQRQAHQRERMENDANHRAKVLRQAWQAERRLMDDIHQASLTFYQQLKGHSAAEARLRELLKTPARVTMGTTPDSKQHGVPVGYHQPLLSATTPLCKPGCFDVCVSFDTNWNEDIETAKRDLLDAAAKAEAARTSSRAALRVAIANHSATRQAATNLTQSFMAPPTVGDLPEEFEGAEEWKPFDDALSVSITANAQDIDNAVASKGTIVGGIITCTVEMKNIASDGNSPVAHSPTSPTTEGAATDTISAFLPSSEWESFAALAIDTSTPSIVVRPSDSAGFTSAKDIRNRAYLEEGESDEFAIEDTVGVLSAGNYQPSGTYGSDPFSSVAAKQMRSSGISCSASTHREIKVLLPSYTAAAIDGSVSNLASEIQAFIESLRYSVGCGPRSVADIRSVHVEATLVLASGTVTSLRQRTEPLFSTHNATCDLYIAIARPAIEIPTCVPTLSNTLFVPSTAFLQGTSAEAFRFIPHVNTNDQPTVVWENNLPVVKQGGRKGTALCDLTVVIEPRTLSDVAPSHFWRDENVVTQDKDDQLFFMSDADSWWIQEDVIPGVEGPQLCIMANPTGFEKEVFAYVQKGTVFQTGIRRAASSMSPARHLDQDSHSDRPPTREYTGIEPLELRITYPKCTADTLHAFLSRFRFCNASITDTREGLRLFSIRIRDDVGQFINSPPQYIAVEVIDEETKPRLELVRSTDNTTTLLLPSTQLVDRGSSQPSYLPPLPSVAPFEQWTTIVKDYNKATQMVHATLTLAETTAPPSNAESAMSATLQLDVDRLKEAEDAFKAVTGLAVAQNQVDASAEGASRPNSSSCWDAPSRHLVDRNESVFGRIFEADDTIRMTVPNPAAETGSLGQALQHFLHGVTITLRRGRGPEAVREATYKVNLRVVEGDGEGVADSEVLCHDFTITVKQQHMIVVPPNHEPPCYVTCLQRPQVSPLRGLILDSEVLGEVRLNIDASFTREVKDSPSLVLDEFRTKDINCRLDLRGSGLHVSSTEQELHKVGYVQSAFADATEMPTQHLTTIYSEQDVVVAEVLTSRRKRSSLSIRCLSVDVANSLLPLLGLTVTDRIVLPPTAPKSSSRKPNGSPAASSHSKSLSMPSSPQQTNLAGGATEEVEPTSIVLRLSCETECSSSQHFMELEVDGRLDRAFITTGTPEITLRTRTSHTERLRCAIPVFSAAPRIEDAAQEYYDGGNVKVTFESNSTSASSATLQIEPHCGDEIRFQASDNELGALTLCDVSGEEEELAVATVTSIGHELAIELHQFSPPKWSKQRVQDVLQRLYLRPHPDNLELCGVVSVSVKDLTAPQHDAAMGSVVVQVSNQPLAPFAPIDTDVEAMLSSSDSTRPGSPLDHVAQQASFDAMPPAAAVETENSNPDTLPSKPSDYDFTKHSVSLSHSQSPYSPIPVCAYEQDLPPLRPRTSFPFSSFSLRQLHRGIVQCFTAELDAHHTNGKYSIGLSGDTIMEAEGVTLVLQLPSSVPRGATQQQFEEHDATADGSCRAAFQVMTSLPNCSDISPSIDEGGSLWVALMIRSIVFDWSSREVPQEDQSPLMPDTTMDRREIASLSICYLGQQSDALALQQSSLDDDDCNTFVEEVTKVDLAAILGS